MADAKGKAIAEETTEGSNKEVDEKSAKDKEKFNSDEDHLELHKKDQEQSAVMNDMFRQWHQGLKSGGKIIFDKQHN